MNSLRSRKRRMKSDPWRHQRRWVRLRGDLPTIQLRDLQAPHDDGPLAGEEYQQKRVAIVDDTWGHVRYRGPRVHHQGVRMSREFYFLEPEDGVGTFDEYHPECGRTLTRVKQPTVGEQTWAGIAGGNILAGGAVRIATEAAGHSGAEAVKQSA